MTSEVRMGTRSWNNKKDGTKVIARDPLLERYAEALKYRYGKYWELRQAVEILEGGLENFASGMDFFGFSADDKGILYREWAPGAKEVYLCGEFNNWNKMQIPLTQEKYGYWSVRLPKKPDGSPPIQHNSKVKTIVVTPGGMVLHRNPAASKFLIQDPSSNLFDTVFWNPSSEEKHKWKHDKWLLRPDSLRIYECHVGMATKEARVGTYREFVDNVLPSVKKLGYTAIQLMAVAEHAYYGSFGYHVTNPFAVSSRCGTPEDLKFLVDSAHSMGIIVLMDLVHSHASSNSMDGINHFDGTDGQYFHEGEQGRHSEWDSRLYNYGHWEVLRFLLTNLKWWLDEYHFDGFRFDGVSSMLYKHHGINVHFTGDYAEYFGLHVDIDAAVYLMLANELIHVMNPMAISIAEDVSGAPTVCQPVSSGGLGFDYRLGMGIPNLWLRLLLEKMDEEWSMSDIVNSLTNRRKDELIVAYVECHDQAIVGDKTVAHHLMGDDLYCMMGTNVKLPLHMERGFALHKMLRFVTYALGGEAYLNFMGNEFGHPGWIDFPREGNNFSHDLARRRWDLRDNEHLRFQALELWDRDMHQCEALYRFCRRGVQEKILHVSDEDKVIVFEKGEDLIFVFNFHPAQSYSCYRVGAKVAGTYEVVLDSDALHTCGLGRVHWDVKHPTENLAWMGRAQSMNLYLPARTCQVYHLMPSKSTLRATPTPDTTPPPPPVQETKAATPEQSKAIIQGLMAQSTGKPKIPAQTDRLPAAVPAAASPPGRTAQPAVDRVSSDVGAGLSPADGKPVATDGADSKAATTGVNTEPKKSLETGSSTRATPAEPAAPYGDGDSKNTTPVVCADGNKEADAAGKKPADAAGKKPADVAGEKPPNAAGEKPADAAGEKPADTAETKAADAAAKKPADAAETKAADAAAKKPADAAETKAADAAAKKPADAAEAKAADATGKKAAIAAGKKAANAAGKKGAKAAGKKQAKTAGKPANTTGKKPADAALRKLANMAGKRPAEAAPSVAESETTSVDANAVADASGKKPADAAAAVSASGKKPADAPAVDNATTVEPPAAAAVVGAPGKKPTDAASSAGTSKAGTAEARTAESDASKTPTTTVDSKSAEPNPESSGSDTAATEPAADIGEAAIDVKAAEAPGKIGAATNVEAGKAQISQKSQQEDKGGGPKKPDGKEAAGDNDFDEMSSLVDKAVTTRISRLKNWFTKST